ncbi:hypothetical protein EV649_5813 [Kribbella sp. VKM Ac-2569]|uniref:hypothetical protein n=1 Tax=Kribbella sp. VKM Ac-2569 TaxID=2512220 RepID=UPI00102B9684|nr:hypothetical protein [Kribbella sp. VKM Ac-2569]RZT15032.1 hypothetical protein EV649_5813 [Kribbella sp. VKM Ac-2569]
MSNTGDPNFAPYPGRYEVARTKGVPPNEEPVLLDITGEADVAEQIDAIRPIVEAGPVPDGGLSWDHRTRVLTVRLVGAVDGSEPEVEAVKRAVLAQPADFTVEFESVRYSREELLELADDIFRNAHEWGPADGGLAGFWDTLRNRIVVLIGDEPEDLSRAWIAAIERRQDERIVYEVVRHSMYQPWIVP